MAKKYRGPTKPASIDVRATALIDSADDLINEFATAVRELALAYGVAVPAIDEALLPGGVADEFDTVEPEPRRRDFAKERRVMTVKLAEVRRVARRAADPLEIAPLSEWYRLISGVSHVPPGEFTIGAKTLRYGGLTERFLLKQIERCGLPVDPELAAEWVRKRHKLDPTKVRPIGAKKVAPVLRLTQQDREDLRLWNIVPKPDDEEARKNRKREVDRRRQRRRRQAMGVKPVDHSVSAEAARRGVSPQAVRQQRKRAEAAETRPPPLTVSQPWRDAGFSCRRTWERHGKPESVATPVVSASRFDVVRRPTDLADPPTLGETYQAADKFGKLRCVANPVVSASQALTTDKAPGADDRQPGDGKTEAAGQEVGPESFVAAYYEPCTGAKVLNVGCGAPTATSPHPSGVIVGRRRAERYRLSAAATETVTDRRNFDACCSPAGSSAAQRESRPTCAKPPEPARVARRMIRVPT